MIEAVLEAIKRALPPNLAERRFHTTSAQLMAHSSPGGRIVVFPTEEEFRVGQDIRTDTNLPVKALFVREVELEHWLWERDREACEKLLHEYLTILQRLPAAPFRIGRGQWLNADNTSPQQHGEAYILRTKISVPVTPVESFVLLEGIDVECACETDDS